jgi:predicted nucleic acid-binding protein
LVLKLAVPEEDSERAQERWEQWAQQGTEVVAPPLLWYEVTSVLRNQAHRGRLTLDESSEALEALLSLNISILSPADLHRTAWELATRLDQPTAYDAHYLALAQELDCPFWTADHRLYQATRDTQPGVNVLAIPS